MGKQFLGRGWKFPVEVDAATGRIRLSEYEEDIAESIGIILETAHGERIMRPDFGCGVHQFAFDTTDETTLHLLASTIEDAIRIWEPRVHEVEVSSVPDEETMGRLNVHIRYVVRTTNNLFNQVYPFYLNEGTR